ncbi:MORC family CW-type zinc finger protein 3-like [Bolinopsis microptera]|uniref:MORC family CW-type zinc finger protein 3-like n=1 Tax=Bolinopsis microptera TaxID=2820187 RepID=UPI003079EA54
MSAANHVKNGVKGDPDCEHGETFNVTSIKQSLLSPAYLHTNSTSHTWAFSAVAELIDNAYDPDVNATQLKIDIADIEGMTCLTFLDNGAGMSPHTLYKMLSFGFCDKDKYAVTRHKPVGHYGNGFKSGSMRLGRDALVLSRHGHGKDSIVSVGLLSQTYLDAIKSETILVPTVSWSYVTHERIESPDAEASLQSIIRFSIFKNEAAILSTIATKIKKTGTYILIYNLRKSATGEHEFDFKKDATDICIVEDETTTDNMLYAPQDRINTNPTTYYSLRAYCSILFLRPKMQIFVRSVKVKTKLIKKSLSKPRDTYRESSRSRQGLRKIVFVQSETENYGIMMLLQEQTY